MVGADSFDKTLAAIGSSPGSTKAPAESHMKDFGYRLKLESLSNKTEPISSKPPHHRLQSEAVGRIRRRELRGSFPITRQTQT